MNFSTPLFEGNLLARYKRFFADVEHQGKKITIHVPNTGSMKGVIDKNSKQPQKCWFSLHDDPTKKLKGTLEAVQTVDGIWVGVNTSNPNRIVNEAIQNSLKTKKTFLKHWDQYSFYKSEYKINKESRLDGVLVYDQKDLDDPQAKKHFIEIKNTTYMSRMKEKNVAQFPDAETERGQKHLVEMMKLMEEGHQCEVIFTVQRKDVDVFSPATDLDPKYADLFYKAVEQGLIVSPLLVELSREQIYLTNKLLNLV